jgi:hypothetical protein
MASAGRTMPALEQEGVTMMERNSRAIAILLLAVSLTTLAAGSASARDESRKRKGAVASAKASKPRADVLQEEPRYGIYYDRYEPTFYTGFAPRAVDPRQIHVHLGRGNQLRVTVVLTDELLDAYARDLQHRRKTYQQLIDDGQIVLTQNTAFEAFQRTLDQAELASLVAHERELTRDERKSRNLALLEKLNPGRVFRIRMPVGELVARWSAGLRPEDRRSLDRDRELELLNALLPTRLWTTETAAGTSKRLRELIAEAPIDGADPAALKRMAPRYLALLDEVSHGLYSKRGDALEFAEFTAIYPIGSLNAYTDYRGRQIPLYPTPGRRALTTHQRTKTVDHIPDVRSYSYAPWIPYMHVGPRMHNAFHTLYWQMDTQKASFLTDEWRDVVGDSRDGRPHRYLWLLSRGPMSHGCTHVNQGHIAEFRQILPADTDQLYEVDSFLNRSYDYDVFDIDGDMTPEVIGVKYYIAYALRSESQPVPQALRVANERRAYYDWLYGGDLRLAADGSGYFENIHDGRYVARQALEGREYDRIGLYEAAYEPEKVQFYGGLIDIRFARELRQVAIHHPYPKEAHIASR